MQNFGCCGGWLFAEASYAYFLSATQLLKRNKGWLETGIERTIWIYARDMRSGHPIYLRKKSTNDDSAVILDLAIENLACQSVGCFTVEALVNSAIGMQANETVALLSVYCPTHASQQHLSIFLDLQRDFGKGVHFKFVRERGIGTPILIEAE